MNQVRRMLAVAVVALGAGGLCWADAPNLVPSPGAPASNPHQVAGWLFSMWNLKDDPTDTGKIDGSVAPDAEGRETLNVASTDTIHNLQMWWQTTDKIACTPGAAYHLSVLLKGSLKSGTVRPTIGLTFLDATGKWLGCEQVAQDGTLPADWQTVEGNVTAPPSAATLGVRVGLVFSDGDATVSYKNVVLTPVAP